MGKVIYDVKIYFRDLDNNRLQELKDLLKENSYNYKII